MPLRLRHISLSTTVAGVGINTALLVWNAMEGSWVAVAAISPLTLLVLYTNRHRLPLLWRWRRPAYRLYRDMERLIEGMDRAQCYHVGEAHLIRAPYPWPAVARVCGQLPQCDQTGVETWETFTLSAWPPAVRYSVSGVITGTNEDGEPAALGVLENCRPALEPASQEQLLEALAEQLRVATPR
jgi:hypothetical protein